MPDSKLIDIAVELRHETSKAYLVHDGDGPIWLPKSQCEVYDNGVNNGGSKFVTVTLPEWLAREKGLI